MSDAYEPVPDDFDYDSLTNEEIDEALDEILESMNAAQILCIDGVYSLLREELNNEILERAAQRSLEREG